MATTMTTTTTLTLHHSSPSPSSSPQHQQQQSQTLTLRLNRRKKKVTWKEGTVDNEFLQKKSSKKCCIFHKDKPFDEDDSDDDPNDGHDHDHPDACSSTNYNDRADSKPELRTVPMDNYMDHWTNCPVQRAMKVNRAGVAGNNLRKD
ncbi:unnamed protein product [Camellia sinensis]